MSHDPLEFLQNALNARFKTVAESIDELIAAFAKCDMELVGTKSQILNDALVDFKSLMAEVNRPGWIKQLEQVNSDFLSRIGQKRERMPHYADALLSKILKLGNQIVPIQLLHEPTPLIDFDSVFETYRESGKLPSLFDELISIVEKIITSGAIERVAVLQAFQQILSLLKANRDGSFVAVKNTAYLAKYLKNFVLEWIKDVPLLKQGIAAYDRTVDEIDSEINAVEVYITQETIRALKEKTQIAQLPNYKTDIEPLLLEDQGDRSISNNDVMDNETTYNGEYTCNQNLI